MKKSVFLLFVLALMVPFRAHGAELHLLAGAGLRQPADSLIDIFQRTTRHNVVADYDGSGRLLAKITTSGKGDLFIPGAFFYIEKLMSEGKIRSFKTIVAHTPVIAVHKDKVGTIKQFSDLAKPGIRLALGDSKAMALGRSAMRILERSGLKERVISNVVVYGATVKQLAIYVAKGEVDASIIARSDVFQFKDKLVMVPIPQEYFEPEAIAVAVLDTTRDIKAATVLQNFLSSPEAVEVFKSFGFLPLD